MQKLLNPFYALILALILTGSSVGILVLLEQRGEIEGPTVFAGSLLSMALYLSAPLLLFIVKSISRYKRLFKNRALLTLGVLVLYPIASWLIFELVLWLCRLFKI